MDSIDVATLRGWTPVRVLTGGADPLVEWAQVAGHFSDPFFEQTADRAMRQPFNQIFSRQTPVEVLNGLDGCFGDAAPAGFIFHMSRCGSTLIAQMLAQLDAAVVFSEPQPVDALIGLHRAGRLSEATLVRSLRGLLAACAAARPAEPRMFVKFHASHVFELPLVLRAFPGVPWIFVFREPRAVLASHAHQPGPETIAGMVEAPYGAGGGQAVAQLEYAARAIGSFCAAALEHAGAGRGRFVEYARLPGAVASELLEFFGVSPGPAEIERMRATADRDTKGPGPWRPPPPGPPELDELAARWLGPRYAELRALSRDG